MSSAWDDLRATYYIGKILGFFPFDGRHKLASFSYSLAVWLSFGGVSVYISAITYVYTEQFSSKHKMLIHIIAIRIFLKFAVSLAGAMVSAQKSGGFSALIDGFDKFDSLTLQRRWPSNVRARAFYLLCVSSIEVYYLSCSLYYSDINGIVLLAWTLVSASTTLMIVQYSLFARALGDRYRTANRIFSDNIDADSTCTETMYPKEIVNLYGELRYLTDDVKDHYACHAILIIIDTILISISCATALILNYTNNLNLTLFNSELFSLYCVFKMSFLFIFIREIHNTVQELEVLIMTYWNNPIVFDVYDFFELDYKLLQMIIASIVTYIVILIQIQLAINEST